MALEPTLPAFRALFPEFAAVPDQTVQFYIDDAKETLSLGVWGNCWGKGVLWLAAHELALSLQRQESATENGGVADVSGVLQAGHEEGIAFTFARRAFTSPTDEYYGTTPYGVAFQALARRCTAASRLSW